MCKQGRISHQSQTNFLSDVGRGFEVLFAYCVNKDRRDASRGISSLQARENRLNGREVVGIRLSHIFVELLKDVYT